MEMIGSYFTVLLVELTSHLPLGETTKASTTPGVVVNVTLSLSSCQISATPGACSTCCPTKCFTSRHPHEGFKCTLAAHFS